MKQTLQKSPSRITPQSRHTRAASLHKADIPEQHHSTKRAYPSRTTSQSRHTRAAPVHKADIPEPHNSTKQTYPSRITPQSRHTQAASVHASDIPKPQQSLTALHTAEVFDTVTPRFGVYAGHNCRGKKLRVWSTLTACIAVVSERGRAKRALYSH